VISGPWAANGEHSNRGADLTPILADWANPMDDMMKDCQGEVTVETGRDLYL